MNILMLMISYPNVQQNTNMYTDLADEFKKNGHNVYVATGEEKRKCNKTIDNSESGINVLRIKIGNIFNVGIIEKGISTITLPYIFNRAINKYFKAIQFDLIVSSTPPITFLPTIKLLKKRMKSKTYLILRDIFPQNAKDLGLINNRFLFNYFRKKEKELYLVVDSIGCMSQGNIEYVKKHNKEVQEGKLHLLPNWVKVNKKNNAQNSNMKGKYGLEDKIVAVFGGNMGKPQALDFLIDVANEVQHIEELMFLLVGDGTEKNRIRNKVNKLNLKNVMIKDQIPREDYQKLISECDIGLISLSDKFTIPNIPSKTLGYFEMELPILACIDKNTDYSKMLDDSKAGFWSITGDFNSYIENLQILLNDEKLRKYMGRNGRVYLDENCDVKKACSIILSKINN